MNTSNSNATANSPSADATTHSNPVVTPYRTQPTRFLWLSDLHISTPLTPVRKRIIHWSADLAKELAPDFIVLGGDITHQPERTQAEAFLAHFGATDAPFLYLPGNYEGTAFPFPQQVHGVTEPGVLREHPNVVLLPAGTVEQLCDSVDWLLETPLPADAPLLVFSHFPPEAAGQERLERLARLPLHWVCGHRHEALQSQCGQMQITIAAGLDPVKVRGSLPECLVIDWNGHSATMQRYSIPLNHLESPNGSDHCLGLAFRGSAEELLETALQEGARALQFHYHYSQGPASEKEIALAASFRCKHPDGFLSLHLPNFSTPEAGIDLNDMAPSLAFAEGMGLDDFTVHLPNVPAAFLYSKDREFARTPWAEQCLNAYTRLSARALAMGAQISFENVYNKKHSPPGEERLSTQPWHLVCFVEELRRRLKAEGYTASQLERVGIIFDAGHAFADIAFSKHYGLPEWLAIIGPYLQLSHIHQVRKKTDGSGTFHHQAISDANGPLVNYHGLLAAFADHSTRPFPLLLEIRDKAAALESHATLLAMHPLRSPALTR